MCYYVTKRVTLTFMNVSFFLLKIWSVDPQNYVDAPTNQFQPIGLGVFGWAPPWQLTRCSFIFFIIRCGCRARVACGCIRAIAMIHLFSQLLLRIFVNGIATSFRHDHCKRRISSNRCCSSGHSCSFPSPFFFLITESIATMPERHVPHSKHNSF